MLTPTHDSHNFDQDSTRPVTPLPTIYNPAGDAAGDPEGTRPMTPRSPAELLPRPKPAAQPRLSWGLAAPLLIVILLVQMYAALDLQNTVQRQEGFFLLNGRQFLQSGSAVTFPGVPYFYPVLDGAVDLLNGLEYARAVSLVFMLAVTLCVYFVARLLYLPQSAVIGAALFAAQASALILSHLATSDALALALLALAVLFTLYAAQSGRFSAALLSGLLLFLAVAVQYSVLLYAPEVLALLGWQSLKVAGPWKALRNVVTVVLVITLGIAVFMVLDPGVVSGLGASINQFLTIPTGSRAAVVQDVLRQSGALLFLALLGFLASKPDQKGIALILLVTALLSPAYYLLRTAVVSFEPQFGFGAFFAAPLAGYGLWVLCLRLTRYAEVQGRIGLRRWLLILAACALLFYFGVSQARSIYNWGNAEQTVQTLRAQIRPGASRLLTDEHEILAYYLQDITRNEQWTSLDTTDVRDAVQQGSFDLIALGNDRLDTRALRDLLRSNEHYELINVIPNWGNNKTNMLIWRRTAK